MSFKDDPEGSLQGWLCERGVSVSCGAVSALRVHAEALLRWNAGVRLTGAGDLAEVFARHTADSLVALPLLEGIGSLLDVGSGGGFPGIPLAIVSPELRVTLVESVGKRAAFLRFAASGLSNVSVFKTRLAGRPQGEGIEEGGFDALAFRAVNPDDVIPRADRYLTPGGRVLYWSAGGEAAERAGDLARGAGMMAGESISYDLPGGERFEVLTWRVG